MNKIFNSESLIRRQKITLLDVPKGLFRVLFTEQLLHAKDPNYQRTGYEFFVNREELTKMRDLCDLALANTHDLEAA